MDSKIDSNVQRPVIKQILREFSKYPHLGHQNKDLFILPEVFKLIVIF